MKAIVATKYGPPDVLQLKEVAKPIPKDNELLVRVSATTVTAGDVTGRSYTVPAVLWPLYQLQLGLREPRNSVLGMELAGEIVSVGKAVTLFRKGDQVFASTYGLGFGSYAEYKCLPEDGMVAKEPTI